MPTSISPRRSSSSPSTRSPTTGPSGFESARARAGHSSSAPSPSIRRTATPICNARTCGTYDDLSAAETDFRKGLELSPNAAEGYAGLATVLYEDPARREEALKLLERARRIDPLEPDYDVFKAVFLMYERGDLQGADELLSSVLERHPRYLPALVRQCEIRSMLMGRQADAIRLCEQALAVDPLAAEARLHLIKDYHELGESAAAEQVAGEAGRDSVVPQVLFQMYERDWVRAGEGAYDAIAGGRLHQVLRAR